MPFCCLFRSGENKRETNKDIVDYRDIVNKMATDDVDDENNYRRALVILKRVLAKAASPDSTELMTPFRLLSTTTPHLFTCMTGLILLASLDDISHSIV